MTRARLATIGFFAIVVAACSLNPQPFPPAPQDNEDRGGSLDADASLGPDVGFGHDSGTTPIDCGSEADTDGGIDAPYDAPLDAPLDADPDAELDAPNDIALSSD